MKGCFNGQFVYYVYVYDIIFHYVHYLEVEVSRPFSVRWWENGKFGFDNKNDMLVLISHQLNIFRVTHFAN